MKLWGKFVSCRNKFDDVNCEAQRLLDAISAIEVLLLQEDPIDGSFERVISVISQLPELAVKAPRNCGVSIYRLVSFFDNNRAELALAGLDHDFQVLVWNLFQSLLDGVMPDGQVTDDAASLFRIGGLAHLLSACSVSENLKPFVEPMLCAITIQTETEILRRLAMEFLPFEAQNKPPMLVSLVNQFAPRSK